ncbi:MAG: glycoside hydrolase family 95-like protein, partial [Luteolibacter sp.]
PGAWPEGSYRGLLARGNFEVSAQWSDGQASQLEVLSKAGGALELRYPNVAKAVIKTSDGQTVDFVAKGTDQVSIKSAKGETYVITEIPAYVSVAAPSELEIDKNGADQVTLSWKGGGEDVSYNLYRAVGNAPDYELVASKIAGTDYVYKAKDLKDNEQMTLKVTAVRADGRESSQGATAIRLAP